MSLVQREIKKITVRPNGVEKQIRPSKRTPWLNTLWYLDLDQSDAAFTDARWHTVTNTSITYNSSWVSNGCWYNNSNWKRLYSNFDGWDTRPTNFTLMCFMKPTWNHYTNDHPMWISLANASTKVTLWIGFSQTNTQVQFNYLRESIAWTTQSYNYSPLNTRHHYALTYDGATMIWYIDGTPVTSVSISGTGSWTWPNWWLTVFWRNHPSYTNTIQWYVDEVIVEKKVWTAVEIQTYLSEFTY